MNCLFNVCDLSQTETLCNLIARVLPTGFSIAMNGELGSGKTTCVKFILRAMGVVGHVKSPTFTIVEQYSLANFEIYHFDLYRFNSQQEWYDLGFYEYFGKGGICFVEWAEKALDLIPLLDWHIEIRMQNEQARGRQNDSREIIITPKTTKGLHMINNLCNLAQVQAISFYKCNLRVGK
jgi:tRNA threonylcarbamoyladenosine biosynthesis protein TsaE